MRAQCGDTDSAGCRVRRLDGSGLRWPLHGKLLQTFSGSESGKPGWSVEGNESSKDRFLFDI